MQIEPPIWCFYCCRIDFDFHPFIGIFTEFNRSDPFITEEGDRFMLSALGLHTPVRGHASWLLCAVSTGWGYIECGTQMSGLIRHNRGSSSLHLSSPMYINGALHFLSIFTAISTEFVDFLCADVRTNRFRSSFILPYSYCTQTRG